MATPLMASDRLTVSQNGAPENQFSGLSFQFSACALKSIFTLPARSEAVSRNQKLKTENSKLPHPSCEGRASTGSPGSAEGASRTGAARIKSSVRAAKRLTPFTSLLDQKRRLERAATGLATLLDWHCR
jgi:hypothetical protein